jgi:hypothetical protein
MAAGVAFQPWTVRDIISLLENAEAAEKAAQALKPEVK